MTGCSRMLEDELQSRIRLSLGKRTDCVFWRNAVGVADTKLGHKVSYGLGRGSSDLVGMLRPSGRFIVLEIKIEGGRVSSDQDTFIRLINIGGGFGRVVRSVEEANHAVDQAIASADAWIGKTFSRVGPRVPVCGSCFGFGSVSGPVDDDGEPTERTCPKCRL